MQRISKELQKSIIHKSFELYRLCEGYKENNIFNKNFWTSAIMGWCIQTPFLKSRVFNFVDVLPSLKNQKQLQDHLEAYFLDNPNFLNKFLKASLNFVFNNPLSSKPIYNFVQYSSKEMARTFIAGKNLEEVIPVLTKMHSQNLAFTLDLLGEATLTEREAQENLEKHIQVLQELAKYTSYWTSHEKLNLTCSDKIPIINLSVKLSSLYSQISAINFNKVKEILKSRLRLLLIETIKTKAFLNIDMEDFEMKDLTITVLTSLLEESDFRDCTNIGIVIQAYLRSSEEDLLKLVNWCKTNNRSIQIRLVKGAYWDHETIKAKQNNWPLPVFSKKEESDFNYEKLSRILLQNWQFTRPAFASHNIRSVAHAISLAEHLKVPKENIEFQMLYGMANSLKISLINLGFRCREYVPMGELIPGMAYFVRRLMENTANQSFITLQNFKNASPKVLLKPPKASQVSETLNQKKEFSNSLPLDFSNKEERKALEDYIAEAESRLGEEIPIVINGKEIRTARFLESLNPCNPSQVVAKVHLANSELAELALESAKDFQKTWANIPIEKRAQILYKTAKILEEKRKEISAWEILEVAKSWKEADADLSEAIDFCNYYANEALKLAQGKTLLKVPGEDNQYLYRPKGVGVVIAPWNFPLAIPLGMIAAALVMGNTVVFKPAEQAMKIGCLLYKTLKQAGCPDGALHFLPGLGEEIGPSLVESNKTSLIAFTGSAEVGLQILERANKKSSSMKTVKKVIAEMGGKNALIIDEDADLDDSIRGALYSAFGFQGQKCSALSRLLIHENIYDEFIKRFKEAMQDLKVSPAKDPECYLSALIDETAYSKTLKEIEKAKSIALKVTQSTLSENVASGGYFIPPTLIEDLTFDSNDSELLQKELFAPVVIALKFKDIQEAINIVNSADYALTGGIYSRNPKTIKQIKENLEVGNLYINRSITGAIVGRHPFGGYKLSGVGSKAGGPDYLLQFTDPITIVENTTRRGYSPDLE